MLLKKAIGLFSQSFPESIGPVEQSSILQEGALTKPQVPIDANPRYVHATRQPSTSYTVASPRRVNCPGCRIIPTTPQWRPIPQQRNPLSPHYGADGLPPAFQEAIPKTSLAAT